MPANDDKDLAFAGIARQAEMLREKAVSSRELTELYLGRIGRLNPQLNAFHKVFAESALAAAAEADERIAAGGTEPLLGVPVALKDTVDVAGDVTSYGTAAFDQPAGADSEHWRRLKDAGAVLLGKTTLPELAICGFTETEAWGDTRNPWNPDRTPGGSSGGSAAAVAAGMVGAASASDGAGSIRIPAACCGLFGLKPQRDRISLAPLEQGWLGLSVDGCVSRHVIDTALWLDVAAGAATEQQSPAAPGSFVEAARTAPERLRVAISLKSPRALAPPLLTPEVRAAVERIGEVLRGLGHIVEAKDPVWGLVGNDAATRYLKGIERDYDAVPHPERLESRTRGFKRLAAAIPEVALKKALESEARHSARINRIFDEHDLLLTPLTGTTPVAVGRWRGRGALRTVLGMSRVYPNTIPWNHLGQPAAAIPAGFSADGLPLSAQIVAPAGREGLLLSVAAQLEAELCWADHKPALG